MSIGLVPIDMHPPLISDDNVMAASRSRDGDSNVAQFANMGLRITSLKTRVSVFFWVGVAILLIMAVVGCKTIVSEPTQFSPNRPEVENQKSRTSHQEIVAATAALNRELEMLRAHAEELSKGREEKGTFTDLFKESSVQTRLILEKAARESQTDEELAKSLEDLHRLKRELAITRDRFAALLADDGNLQETIDGLLKTEQGAHNFRDDVEYSITRASYQRMTKKLVKLQLASAETREQLMPLASLHVQIKTDVQDIQSLDTSIDVKIAQLNSQASRFASPTPSVSATPLPSVAPTPVILPSGTPTATSAASPIIPTSEIDRILQTLPWGGIVFRVDQKTVRLNSETNASLVILPQKSEQDLETEVRQKLAQDPNVAIQPARVRISGTMRATLTSTDAAALTVVPSQTDDNLAVSFQNDTTWLWKIRANKVGTYSLWCTLYASVSVNDKNQTYKVKTYSDQIEVNVTTGDRVKDFLAQYWQWLMTTLIVPVGIFLYRRFKRKPEIWDDVNSP